MSNGSLLSPRPDIAGMARLRLRLGSAPSPVELERAREQIYSRLVDTPKGVVLDCDEIGTTSVDVLAMLYTAQTFAASEGKRLALDKIGGEFGKLLSRHGKTFRFDIYGAKPSGKTPAAAKRPTRKPWLNATAKRRLRNIGLPVAILFPLVGLTEYYLLLNSPGNESVAVEKSFEPQIHVVRGRVETLRGGIPTPARRATVAAWLVDQRPAIVRRGWVTRTDDRGRYSLPVELDPRRGPTTLQIAITEAENQASALAADAQPVRRPTQVFRRVIRADRPLEVNARFDSEAQQ